MTDLTKEQAKALASRWMALDAFEWTPGMCDGESGGIIGYDARGSLWLMGEPRIDVRDYDECWPDLRHPGTLGIALAQARKMHGHPLSPIFRESMGKMSTPRKRWLIEYARDSHKQSAWVGYTEADVIIAAMEAVNG